MNIKSYLQLNQEVKSLLIYFVERFKRFFLEIIVIFIMISMKNLIL